MNKKIEFSGHLLTASADDRTLTYLLLPFGEVGNTNVGQLTATAGSVKVPEDVASLEVNEEHDFRSQIGKFTRVEETPRGLEATIRIVNTSRGNDALVLAAEGLRTGISVEIAEPVIRAGRLISGRLTGAGLVVRPAFSNARLTAADCGDIEKESPVDNETNLEAAEVSPVQAAPITASNLRADLGSITFNAYKTGVSIQAALADQLASDDLGKAYIKDQEVGELFEAHKSERPLVEAIGVKPLTSIFVTGTKKARTFAVADWNGNKTELPTGKFTTSRENWAAKMKAVGVDIDITLLEFGSEEVISDLYAQAVDSYIEQTETEMVTLLSAEATAVTGTTSAVAAVNKAAEVLGGIGARMSFVVCSADVYAKLVSLKVNDAPWWLSANGGVDLTGQKATLGNVTLTSDPELANGTILVGDSRAVDYRESKDFRYRAADIAHGGMDISLIKFYATKVTDAGAILKFTGITGA